MKCQLIKQLINRSFNKVLNFPLDQQATQKFPVWTCKIKTKFSFQFHDQIQFHWRMKPPVHLKDRTTNQTSNHLSITSVIFSILSVMPFTSYWIRSAVMLSFFLKDPVVEVWIKLKCQVWLAWVTHLLYFVIETKDYFPLVKGVAK